MNQSFKLKIINILVTILIFIFIPVFPISTLTPEGSATRYYSVVGLISRSMEQGALFSRQFMPGIIGVIYSVIVLVTLYSVIAFVTGLIKKKVAKK